jgi:hypothetical protein
MEDRGHLNCKTEEPKEKKESAMISMFLEGVTGMKQIKIEGNKHV